MSLECLSGSCECRMSEERCKSARVEAREAEYKDFAADLIGAFILRDLQNGARYSVAVAARNSVGWSSPTAPVVSTPNTPLGRFKGVFSLCCAGPAASTDAVAERNPFAEVAGGGNGGSNDQDQRRRVSSNVDFGAVYSK